MRRFLWRRALRLRIQGPRTRTGRRRAPRGLGAPQRQVRGARAVTRDPPEGDEGPRGDHQQLHADSGFDPDALQEQPVPVLPPGRRHQHQQAAEARQALQRSGRGLLRLPSLVQGWRVRDQPHRWKPPGPVRPRLEPRQRQASRRAVLARRSEEEVLPVPLPRHGLHRGEGVPAAAQQRELAERGERRGYAGAIVDVQGGTQEAIHPGRRHSV